MLVGLDITLLSDSKFVFASLLAAFGPGTEEVFSPIREGSSALSGDFGVLKGLIFLCFCGDTDVWGFMD